MFPLCDILGYILNCFLKQSRWHCDVQCVHMHNWSTYTCNCVQHVRDSECVRVHIYSS